MITVVKIGGSLSADPDRRRALLRDIADGVYGACVVVPGGGAFADCVRERQRRDGFDDATAHRLALDAMGRMAAWFCEMEPRLVRTETPWVDAYRPPPSAGAADPRSGSREGQRDEAGFGPHRALFGYGTPLARPLLTRSPPSPPEEGGKIVGAVWDPAALRAGHPDIPETWDVTSDSLALWLAARLRAQRCVLVKSADAPHGFAAGALGRLGLVDAAFPAFAAGFSGAIELWGPSGPVSLPRRAAA